MTAAAQLRFAWRLQEPPPLPRRRPRLRLIRGGPCGHEQLELPLETYEPRPRTRGGCERFRLALAVPHREHRAPCPWLSCRHHLWHAESERFAELLDEDPEHWPHTCSLDVAEAVAEARPGTVIPEGRVGKGTLERGWGLELSTADIARHLATNRESVRKNLRDAIDHMRQRPLMAEVSGEVDHQVDWWGELT